ncbi:hypothetical protein JW926_12330 [Candidatus Sumerlaeota bacterium]|nr:hypothetical protein [Candidatus Sumerlaeota bacterium]
MNRDMAMEGRCADCVLDMLQISGRGPGKYGFCRLRRVVLEHPWAMICAHYQYWGDRPSPGRPRVLLERAAHPLMEYSTQKPIHLALSPEEFKAQHANEQDDDIKRNIGATLTAQEFIDSSPIKQAELIKGYLTGFNPYNLIIAINALHFFFLEDIPKEKGTEILDLVLSPERKTVFAEDMGMIEDKVVYAVAWALARINRDLMEYIDSLRLKKHKPDYRLKIMEAARKFVRDPKIKPRKSLLSFFFGK